ncbi:MAG: hypothetical protein COA40_01260 [Aequorivita sp.]|nr:MAG: hypothetical protein COA40_01260 [Aequorivita sp.]
MKTWFFYGLIFTKTSEFLSILVSLKISKMTKIVKDSDNEKERDYILQDNKKTRFGAGFIITVLIILIIAVIISGFYFEWF